MYAQAAAFLERQTKLIGSRIRVLRQTILQAYLLRPENRHGLCYVAVNGQKVISLLLDVAANGQKVISLLLDVAANGQKVISLLLDVAASGQ